LNLKLIRKAFNTEEGAWEEPITKKYEAKILLNCRFKKKANAQQQFTAKILGERRASFFSPWFFMDPLYKRPRF
jgi:hypothetical protein